MSKFFDSDVIRAELVEINRLQEELYTNMIHFDFLTEKEKIRNLDLLSDLLEKQQIMWTRLSLEDSEDAQLMKDHIQASAVLMGFKEDTDIGLLFKNMQNTIEEIRKNLDKDSTVN